MSKLMLDGERKHDKAKLQLHLNLKHVELMHVAGLPGLHLQNS